MFNLLKTGKDKEHMTREYLCTQETGGAVKCKINMQTLLIILLTVLMYLSFSSVVTFYVLDDLLSKFLLFTCISVSLGGLSSSTNKDHDFKCHFFKIFLFHLIRHLSFSLLTFRVSIL